MNNDKSYSDVEFAQLCNDKVGNVVVFKRVLRKYGLIGNRVQLTGKHAPLFLEAKSLHIDKHMNWMDAFITVISPLEEEHHDVDDQDVLSVLHEILNVLQRIEQKL
ncbi:hypothetical protein [Niallia taxi]|uniref:hypothetical protein n=1 Tax=Niallia taxi TaxID=2499688 RepID=UPI0015F40AA3|nr:hypothetical protein [Niallia taxi]